VNRQALVSGGIAVVVVAAALAGILLSSRRNRLQLTGEILKVRSHQTDSDHTLALIDLRIHNPSPQQFQLKEIEVFVDDPDGTSTQADLFAESDVQRMLDYYPMLGAKYNPGLLRKDKIRVGQTVDRTIAANIPITDERLGQRKRLRIVLHDADGPVIEIDEKR
jgi:hypothetical protein